jgi:hypothetical protein
MLMHDLSGRVHRPSPALVVAIVALVAALTGGAYAAKKIGTSQLAKKSVTTKKLAKIERSQGFFTKQAANLPLPAATDTTVATLTLPSSGNFQVTASVALGGASAGVNPIRCQLRDDGPTLTAGDGYSDQAAFSDTVTLTWFSDGGSVTLACNPTNNSVARDRVIAATRVARVQTQ